MALVLQLIHLILECILAHRLPVRAQARRQHLVRPWIVDGSARHRLNRLLFCQLIAQHLGEMRGPHDRFTEEGIVVVVENVAHDADVCVVHETGAGMGSISDAGYIGHAERERERRGRGREKEEEEKCRGGEGKDRREAKERRSQWPLRGRDGEGEREREKEGGESSEER